MLKKYIPFKFKRKIRLIQRARADRKSRLIYNFAKKSPPLSDSVPIVSIEQPIFYNPLAANKVFNIELAIQEIHQVVIQPEETFSFWHIVGNPTEEKGYKTGRNIIGDSLKEDIGGGLCQVSGMLYHLALTAGLKIVERHNHTLDLYEEDKRYTPLGTDATVVYGYKDIRFKNTSSAPIQFKFSVSESNFIGTIYAANQIPTYALNFERKEFDGYRTIDTYRSGIEKENDFINHSKYILT